MITGSHSHVKYSEEPDLMIAELKHISNIYYDAFGKDFKSSTRLSKLFNNFRCSRIYLPSNESVPKATLFLWLSYFISLHNI